jgi:NTP pyrophosphatase (non-canonical NTP hydrolase)
MELDEYQKRAELTDQTPSLSQKESTGADVLIPLLGLAGEAGELLSEYKKFLRDGPAYKLFGERLSEELGDLLWYLSNCASKFGLSLDDIANENLAKCQARWEYVSGYQSKLFHSFDASFPETERLPRRLTAEFATETRDGVVLSVCTVDGVRLGDPLSDNSYDDDGYRFHDILHLAFVAVLGWSPTIRSLLKRKRKSDPTVDLVEDGARARFTEEGLAALIFSFAEQHSFLDGFEQVSYDVLRTIKAMTRNLEVSQCSPGQWEDAILQGFAAWRTIRNADGGRLIANLDQARLEVA